MHGSLSQFKATLARKKARKDSQQGKFDRKNLNYKSSNTKTEFDFPKLSETELKKVKNDIREKLKSDNKKKLISITIIIVILVLVIMYLIQI